MFASLWILFNDRLFFDKWSCKCYMWFISYKQKNKRKKHSWKNRKYVFVKKLFMGLGKASKHDIISLGELRQFLYIGVRRWHQM